MNYSKFSGLVACKMAMLLAFMFAGLYVCSLF